MSMETVFAVLAVTVVGLMVGVEFSVAFVINPILRALPLEACIEARAHGGRMLGRVMPFWYFGSLVLIAVLAILTWGGPAATAGVIAVVLMAASVVLSIALLVPLNNRGKHWTAENHPADWRELQQRWDRLHYLRVAVIVAAFILVAVAATTV
ncbi:anthrone oxygenase family protein [Arthrobacter sp. NPDC090010]|uniref:anthrone oxygenase family protein n=1 Tax=Arthrobacter sp. NPDC090010 TaxID=3363942 RepID=UPI003829EADC